MSEILVRKDGSQSIANMNGIGINAGLVDAIVEDHARQREAGMETAEVSSGAVLQAMKLILAMGKNPDDFSDKQKAMLGMPGHFQQWSVSAQKNGLLVASSLSTAIELKDTEEGKQIRGGMGEALANSDILLVANYHDEADSSEMDFFKKMNIKNGNLLKTESEENDFHAANIAIAVGAKVLVLCTKIDGKEFTLRGKRISQLNIEDSNQLIALSEEKAKKGVRKGGLKTKIGAARLALSQGISVFVGDSSVDSRRILEGDTGFQVVQ